jgi:hypothetical protein
VTLGQATGVITTTGFVLRFQQWAIRSALVQFRINYLNDEATPRGGRFTFDDCHKSLQRLS